MKKLLFLSSLLTISAFARIEDNSFLLEEAFNQEYGIYQFIQVYQTPTQKRDNYDYSFENEIPLTDKVHQLSYEIPMANTDSSNRGGVGDMVLNYRWQPLNKDGFLLAERFGLITPTGSVKNGTGSGAYGFEFTQAATLTVNDRLINHWNLGFSMIPNAKTSAHNFKRTVSSYSAASSLIYLLSDNFNLMLESVISSTQQVDEFGQKSALTSVILNPGMRFAIDLDYKETQIVPGISFPVDVINAPTERSILVYLSIEPKFY